MPRIRTPPRGFAPVAPGGGVSVGAGLQGFGQVLESFSELRTNLELLDIQDQRQINRLEQAQFEKVERSNAIREHTTKQIWRNQTAERILVEARKARNYGDVQKQMDEAESDYDQNLFEGRTQQFIDTFGSIDSSARVGLINKLGTATQAGNLGLIRDDYQESAQNFADSVDALTTPEEINRFYDDLDENGVSMGFTEAWIEATSGENRREAMENYVRSLPLIDGLAALSEEEVAGTLGEERRERMSRDLNTKANKLVRAQERFSAVHARVTGIDILDAFVFNGESASSIATRIRNDENISETLKQDMLDFLDVIAISRENGPQEVDTETIKVNEASSELRMRRLVRRAAAIQLNEDELKPEVVEEALEQVIDIAILIYKEAAVKTEDGAFSERGLIKLRALMWPITESFVKTEVVTKSFLEKLGGVVDRAFEGLSIGLSPPAARAFLAREQEEEVSVDDMAVPTAIVARQIGDMFLNEGRYGGLSAGDKFTLEVELINLTNKTAGSNKALPIEEANTLAQGIFSAVQKQFLLNVKGIAPEDVERVGDLMFNSGPPVTGPRQQADITGMADPIRRMLNRGKTAGEIEEFARTQPNFSQNAFDRALAAAEGPQ